VDTEKKYDVKSRVLEPEDIHRIVLRIAHEIIENNRGTQDLALVGIRTRGEFLAKRLAENIFQLEKVRLPLGILDVSFYRDDTRAKLKQPVVQSTEIHFDLTGKNIILVDDVLFTGRSVRAALDEIMDFGRPTRVQVAVLIDRGHREMPIQGDYVGKHVTTVADEEIRVRLKEYDGVDEVVLVTVKK